VELDPHLKEYSIYTYLFIFKQVLLKLLANFELSKPTSSRCVKKDGKSLINATLKSRKLKLSWVENKKVKRTRLYFPTFKEKKNALYPRRWVVLKTFETCFYVGIFVKFSKYQGCIYIYIYKGNKK